MSDVAALAGVSPITVSRVMNGNGRVDARTRSRVDDAMASLRYAPNREARRLAGRKAIRIGVLYGSRFVGDLGQFLIGLSNQANVESTQVLVERCESADEEAVRLASLLASGVDGIILTPLADTGHALAVVAAADVPAVAVGCGPSDPRVGTVAIDDDRAAYHMTRHLLSLGHRRIGVIAGSPDDVTVARRLTGHRFALDATGVARDDALLVAGTSSYRCGLDAAGRLLGLANPPTAIFATSDDLAAATVAAAQRRGLDIPGDLTVTGFGDGMLATTIWPALTTIRQPSAEMARAAVRSLVRDVYRMHRGVERTPEHLRIEYELMRRQSDAAPRVRPQQSWEMAVEAGTLHFI
jgi:LacI family transcriptional regulator